MEQMNEKFQITEQQLKQELARKVYTGTGTCTWYIQEHVHGNDCVEKAAGMGDGVWCLCMQSQYCLIGGGELAEPGQRV